MKRLLLIFTLIVMGTSCLLAQNISVESFRLDEMDLTANQQGTIVLDQNGEKCALIKIRTTQTGFSFDVGSLGVQKTEQKAGEVWVYIPHGVRKITIQHAQLGTCEYPIPINVDKARTYIMQLTTGQVQTIVKNTVTAQYVMFKLSPKNAVVELDGKILSTHDGKATQRLPFGTYEYTIKAPDHYPTSGEVVVDNPNEKHVVEINLTPAFTNVSLSTDVSNCEVWINDERKGNTPWTGTLGYGTYLIECKKDGYRTSSQDVTISPESHDIKLKSPTPMYGSLNIESTPADATIYIDGVKVGSTPMFIPEQLCGEHNFSIELQGYKSYKGKITIDEGKDVDIKADLEDIYSKVKNKQIKSSERLSAVESALESLLGVSPPSPSEDEKVFDVVERMPSFSGGEAAMMQYISSNIRYPKDAEDNGIQGRVIVQFVVCKDGSISGAKVLKGVAPSIDKEAIRLVNNMPKWIPGIQNGKPVNVNYRVPLTFRLQ